MSAIHKALVAAQAAIGNPKKNKTNPHFRNTYADLAAVLDMIHEPLAANGLAVLQMVQVHDQEQFLKTVLVHESGTELDCGSMLLQPTKRDPQGYGSAITYARRYSLMALFGMAAEDDDGQAASRGGQVGAVDRVNRRFAKGKEPEQDYGDSSIYLVEEIVAGMQQSKDMDDLNEWAKKASNLKASDRLTAREAYAKRRDELSEDAEDDARHVG